MATTQQTNDGSHVPVVRGKPVPSFFEPGPCKFYSQRVAQDYAERVEARGNINR